MSSIAPSSTPENEMISQMAQRFAAIMAAAGSPSGPVTGFSSGTPHPVEPAPPAAGGSVMSASPASSGGSGAAPGSLLASTGAASGGAASGGGAAGGTSGLALPVTDGAKVLLELEASVGKMKVIHVADTATIKTSGEALAAANAKIGSLQDTVDKTATHLQTVTAELKSTKAALKLEMEKVLQERIDASDTIHGDVQALMNKIMDAIPDEVTTGVV